MATLFFCNTSPKDPETGCVKSYCGTENSGSAEVAFQACKQAYYLKKQTQIQSSAANNAMQLGAENQDLKSQLETTKAKYNQLLANELKNPQPQTSNFASTPNFILFAVIVILAGYIFSQKFKINKK
jgi:hypothetical protein